MGLQDQWAEGTPVNVGKANATSVIGGPSAYLTGTIQKFHGMVVVSYDTANNLVKWHLYAWDQDALTYVDLSNSTHTHSSTSGDGGEFFEILVSNENAFWFNDLTPLKAHWQGQVFSGTGAAIADDTTAEPSIKLSTGTTTTGYATIFQGGIQFNFDFRCRWSGQWKLSAITNILFRWGLGTEDPNAATNNNVKIGIEWCDSQAQPNYYTLSASGSSRSLVDSTVPLTTGTDAARIVFYPASKAQYKFDNGTLFDKTSVLPSGNIDALNIVRWGAKNNNGGASNRDLFVKGTFANGKITLGGWPTG